MRPILLLATLLLLSALTGSAAGARPLATRPDHVPPVWPHRLHARLAQARVGGRELWG